MLSDDGDIAAVVWARHHPLVAPPGATTTMLWTVFSPLRHRGDRSGVNVHPVEQDV